MIPRQDREARDDTCALRLFCLMSDRNWHTWKELQEVAGKEHNGRMAELENLGWVFDRRTERGPDPQGDEYRLVSLEPGPPLPIRASLRVYEASLEPLLDLLVYVREQVRAGAPGFDPTWDLPDVIRVVRKSIGVPRRGVNHKLRDQCLRHTSRQHVN